MGHSRRCHTQHAHPEAAGSHDQNEGGPEPADIVNLLFRESNDPETDIGTFLDVLALNWLIAGTDAHAKNYSLVLSPGGVRLAPLYDLISVFPYPRRISHRQAKLAMSIDREYHVWCGGDGSSGWHPTSHHRPTEVEYRRPRGAMLEVSDEAAVISFVFLTPAANVLRRGTLADHHYRDP